MQVVFLQDVKSVAKKGDVKNVKDGYFQNFLLPNKLASLATPAMVRFAEGIKKKQVIEKEKLKEQAEEIKAKLDGKKLNFKMKSKGDKLYGSIKEKDVADLLEKEFNLKLGKDAIRLSEHIKVAGSYEIPVKLSETVEAKILLEVKGEK
jgi:large subunit ribosomal protein L9